MSVRAVDCLGRALACPTTPRAGEERGSHSSELAPGAGQRSDWTRRASCRPDRTDPDELIPIGTKAVEIADDGGVEMRRINGPAWLSYADEASRFITALRALHSGLDIVAVA